MNEIEKRKLSAKNKKDVLALIGIFLCLGVMIWYATVYFQNIDIMRTNPCALCEKQTGARCVKVHDKAFFEVMQKDNPDACELCAAVTNNKNCIDPRFYSPSPNLSLLVVVKPDVY